MAFKIKIEPDARLDIQESTIGITNNKKDSVKNSIPPYFTV